MISRTIKILGKNHAIVQCRHCLYVVYMVAVVDSNHRNNTLNINDLWRKLQHRCLWSYFLFSAPKNGGFVAFLLFKLCLNVCGLFILHQLVLIWYQFIPWTLAFTFLKTKVMILVCANYYNSLNLISQGWFMWRRSMWRRST